jgi:hypothetical protein
MQEGFWQLPFQSSSSNKPYVLLSEMKRFDSAVDDIGWRSVANVFPLDCDLVNISIYRGSARKGMLLAKYSANRNVRGHYE